MKIGNAAFQVQNNLVKANQMAVISSVQNSKSFIVNVIRVFL